MAGSAPRWSSTTAKNTGKTALGDYSAGMGAGKTPDTDPDLAFLTLAWPSLAPAIRAAILALVNASR